MTMQYSSILLQIGSSRCKANGAFVWPDGERIFHARIFASIHRARSFISQLRFAQRHATSAKLSNSLSCARLHFSSGKKSVSKKNKCLQSWEGASRRMCVMAPCHRKKKFGRLIDVDSTFLWRFPVLKVLPLGFPCTDWRLEKRESTIRPRYKIPWQIPWGGPTMIWSRRFSSRFPFCFSFLRFDRSDNFSDYFIGFRSSRNRKLLAKEIPWISSQ